METFRHKKKKKKSLDSLQTKKQLIFWKKIKKKYKIKIHFPPGSHNSELTMQKLDVLKVRLVFSDLFLLNSNIFHH